MWIYKMSCRECILNLSARKILIKKKKFTNKKDMGYLLFYIITVHPVSAMSRLYYYNIHRRQPHFYMLFVYDLLIVLQCIASLVSK
jgi:hypothetical protein